MRDFLCNSAYFSIALSIIAYKFGMIVKDKLKFAIFNPLLIAAIIIVAFLLVTGIPYEAYALHADKLRYLLTPATVCLAVPLYEQFDLLKENKKTAQAALNSATASKASIYAQIESIDKSLRDAVVTAPIAGTVTACNVKASEVLSSAAIPVTITDTSKLKINVNVSQRIINSVHVGDSVTVKTETLSSTIAGTVTTVNAAANSNGTYEVEIQIANASDRIKPGMFAEVTFVNEKGSSCIVVDRDTVITKNGETYVFVDENGKAVKKIVETGIDDGKKIQITKGISVGDVIIVKGQNYVSEGDELSVANSDDSNNASVAPSTSSKSSNADNASSSKEGAESSADSSAKKGE